MKTRRRREDFSYEAQPLVSREAELFLEGRLTAAEYLSGSIDSPVDDRSCQRVEMMLSVLLAVAGVAFFVNVARLFADGGDAALWGLLASGAGILATQLVLEIRRRRRHGG